MFEHTQMYKLAKNKAFLEIQSPSMDIVFEIDREIVSMLTKYNWRLRGNGTALSRENVPLTHAIYQFWNGYKPRRVGHRDGNTRDCRIQNLYAILS